VSTGGMLMHVHTTRQYRTARSQASDQDRQ
jgi:hypothetical protein